MRPEIKEQARNRWVSLLPHLGVEAKFLTGKNCPCPKCGGKDRFRFTNRDGEGLWVCNACGGGDGLRLAMLINDWTFEAAAAAIREILPSATAQAEQKRVAPDQRREWVRNMWRAAKPITRLDDAGYYLLERGIPDPWPGTLRFLERCKLKKDDPVPHLPAMLAQVNAPDGKPYTIHRTYLQDGRKAACIDNPRRMMAGDTYPGSYIPLAPAAARMGVAEGIETAFHVMQRFGMPCWSLMSATNLEAFDPPPIVEDLFIFGDNDLKFGGQKSSYALAHRLACKPDPISLCVHLPPDSGTDWADLKEAA